MNDILGSIALSDSGLQVRFKYNQDCFNTIRKIQGVEFDKNSKLWMVPLVRSTDLLKSRLFAESRFRYDFDKNDLTLKLKEIEEILSSAKSRVLANPFSVTQMDLSLLTFDTIFKEGPSGWVCCTIPNSKKAKKIIENSIGVFKTSKKKEFILSASILTELLKRLREEQISFAVEEELSKKLKNTATIRQDVTRSRGLFGGDFAFSSRQMIDAFLSPVILKVEEYYSIDGFQVALKSFLPSSKKATKKLKLSLPEMIDIVLKLYLSGTPVFFCSSMKQTIQNIESQLLLNKSQCSDVILDEIILFKSFKHLWRVDHLGKAGLQLSKEFYLELKKYIGPSFLENYSVKITNTISDSIFLQPNQFKLPLFFDEVSSILNLNIDNLNIRTVGFRKAIDYLALKADGLRKQYEYQSLKDVPADTFKYKNHAKKLYPHQRVAVKWMLETESGLLGDDMGLGKTLSVLTTFFEARAKKEVDFLLIICPNSLVRNWKREAENWFTSSILEGGIRLAMLPDAKKERQSFLEALSEGRQSAIDGLAVNFEAMRLDHVWPALIECTKKRNVFLCIDESQRVKNSQSKTFLAIKNFSFLCKKRFLLSGTPTPKDISDIWSQIFIIDNGKRLGKNYYNWLTSVAELGTKWSEYAVKRYIPAAVEEVTTQLQEVLLRRKKEDVLSLPEKVFLIRDVELGPDQKKRFNQIREELLIQVGSLKGEDQVKSIESVLEEYLRAVQVCSNPRLIDPTWNGTPAKFSELDDIVEDVCIQRGEKLVIWTNYLLNIEELCKRYESLGALPFSGSVTTADRDKNLNLFQSNKKDSPKILVAIPAAGGVGITLTAAQTCVYIDRTWNAEHWLQSIDRLHRIGQTGTVRVIILSGSKVDDLIGRNLKRKSDQMEKLLRGDIVQDEFLPSIKELLEALS